MRPIFCGNFEYDARHSEVERLFSKYGKVERVDMKLGLSWGYIALPDCGAQNTWGYIAHPECGGFAFIYMEDERDAEDAIRALDGYEFGRQGRRLRVEWTKERGGRSGAPKRTASNQRPTKTLFVINFDPINTRTRDLERHFDPHGKIVNIRIRRNFAFIQFESQEDASRALDATNMSKLLDRVISVEYAIRDDDDRRNGHSPDRRDRDRSPGRGRDRRRSPSPYARERGSPDYGRGPSPPARGRDQRSPSPYGRDCGSPARAASPYDRPEQNGSPNHRRSESLVYDRNRSRSPRRERS